MNKKEKKEIINKIAMIFSVTIVLVWITLICAIWALVKFFIT